MYREKIMNFRFSKIPEGMQFVPFTEQSDCQSQLRQEDAVTLGRGIDRRILGWIVPVVPEPQRVFR